jgi:hypothetical protein
LRASRYGEHWSVGAKVYAGSVLIRESTLALLGSSGADQCYRVALPVRERVGPEPVWPEAASDRRASVDLARLIAGTVEAFLPDHVEYRRRWVNLFQQGSIQVSGIDPARPTVGELLHETTLVLPASFTLMFE